MAPSTDCGAVRVLYVDDDAGVRERVGETLGSDERFDVVAVAAAATALDRAAPESFDCVVAEYDLPETGGLDLFEALRDRGVECPFVVFTDRGSERVAGEAVDAGVDGYVSKRAGGVETLARRVESVVERRRAEAALAESRRRLSLFVEQSPLGVVEWDADARFVALNAEAERILGYRESELVGERWELIVPEEGRDDVAAVVESIIDAEGGHHSVNENVREDGERVVCEWHNRIVTDDDGDVVAWFSLVQDVTDRHERQRRLEELTAQYETLIENFPGGGAFLFDEDLRYTVAGGQGLSDVGLTADDFLGATPHDLFPEEVAEETAEHYRRTLGGEHTTYEQEYEGKRWQVLTIPVRDDDGAVTGGLAVSQDVTEQRRRVEELDRQTERLEEFASLVSHDLRNPLSVAEGYVDLARMELSDGVAPETVESRLEDASRAHDRMRRLVENLLTLARANSGVGEVGTHSLVDLSEACWANVDTGDAALVTGADLQLRADRGQLQRLLENLVRNAVEHGSTGNRSARRSGDAVEHGSTGSQRPAGDESEPTAPGASPTRGASADTPPESGADARDPLLTVTIGALPDGDGFYVADDGPGIEPERRDEVFETGHTTAEGGTGLGLRIVEQVAEAHGWTVDLTESADGGARFEFRGVGVVG